MDTASESERKRKQAERVPSTIQFPYTDMNDAIAVAEGLLKGGGVPLSRDQLAAAMGQAPGGGGFSTKVSTARIFGILESVSGKYQLTDLGYEIVDAGRQADAKVKAFMNVELFRRTYDEFRGKLLPPRPHGLDAAFISFGVTAKNTRHARSAFEKSARMAGLYPAGNEDRLVIPFGAPTQAQTSSGDQHETPLPQVASLDISPPSPVVPIAGLHRLILGMLDELPPPKSNWSKKEQAEWLDAIATIFPVIYKSEDGGDISVNYTPQYSD